MKKIIGILSIVLLANSASAGVIDEGRNRKKMSEAQLAAEEAVSDVELQKINESYSENYVVMRDCPVIGNRFTAIYHKPGQPNYNMMMRVNKCVLKKTCADNRKCFDSEWEAKRTRVRICKSGAESCKNADKILTVYRAAKN